MAAGPYWTAFRSFTGITAVSSLSSRGCSEAVISSSLLVPEAGYLRLSWYFRNCSVNSRTLSCRAWQRKHSSNCSLFSR